MNIIKTNGPENAVCEQQARFVLDRVITVETNMADICSTFALFTRKAARLPGDRGGGGFGGGHGGGGYGGGGFGGGVGGGSGCGCGADCGCGFGGGGGGSGDDSGSADPQQKPPFKILMVRDATDEIAKVLASFAEGETINKTLKTGISEVAKTFNLVADFRDLEVQRLERRVVEVFGQYEGVCGRARDELKAILSARDKELGHRRQLDRLIQRNPHNRLQISKAETELIKASSEVSRNQKALEEKIDLFEKKKLKDLKITLLDFIKIELALHAKSLELYTQAYNDMSQVDEDQDLEELKNVLTNDSARLDTVKRTSFRHSSLQSIASLFSTPQRFQRRDSTPTTPKSSHDEITVAANEPLVESRIVSLRDESDEDELSSPFMAGSSQIHFTK